jgi:hypothetical protein
MVEKSSQLNPKVVAVVLFTVMVAVFAVLLGSALSPSAHAQQDAKATTSGATVGTTEGWFNGKTVGLHGDVVVVTA